MPENRRASIIAALQANPNSRQVAREIGVNQVTVWKIAKGRRNRAYSRQGSKRAANRRPSRIYRRSTESQPELTTGCPRDWRQPGHRLDDR
jgi:hypothetical protein